MDANALNYWLSKFVQEAANSEGKVYPARTRLWNYLWHSKAFRRNCGSEALNPLDASDKRQERI